MLQYCSTNIVKIFKYDAGRTVKINNNKYSTLISLIDTDKNFKNIVIRSIVLNRVYLFSSDGEEFSQVKYDSIKIYIEYKPIDDDDKLIPTSERKNFFIITSFYSYFFSPEERVN